MFAKIFKGWHGPEDQTKTPMWEPIEKEKLTIKNLLFSNDYRMIGLKYMLFSLVFFVIGGMAALLFRFELGAPGETIMNANEFYRLMTAHGLTMVFLWIIPGLFGVAYYMLPKLLKTDKLLWAGAAHVSFWTAVVAGILVWIVRSDASWTFYPPMGLRVGGDLAPLFYIAVMLIALSEFLSGAVFVYNTLKNRAMTLKKMPLMGWAMLVDGLMILLSVPALFAVGLIMLTDWMGATALFDPATGGTSSLFMYLFWWYGHPAVYLPLLPAIGIIYTLLPRLLQRPMWSYGSGVLAFTVLAILGFDVFHHHYFPSVSPHSFFVVSFSITTLLIIIPSSMHVFNWIATLWGGASQHVRRLIPFKFMIGSIALLIYGGVTGLINAQIPLNTAFVHDSYFVVGHFHAMFLGFMTQMVIAAFYYLYPYMMGRMYSERLGNLHFWLWQAGIWIMTTMFYLLGLMGMPRRVFDYFDTQWIPNLIATIGAFLIAFGMLVFIYNVIRSVRNGEKVTADPYTGESLSSKEVA